MDTPLPPGQRVIDHFPRFGVLRYAKRLPQRPATVELRIEAEDGSACLPVGLEDLIELPRREIVADFHCVTTWTRRALAWSGYAFRDFHERLLVPRARPGSSCRYVELDALDGYTACLLLEDLLEDNVLLADRLNGEPIPLAHGAPFRLVVPQLYGYKSIKHVSAIRPRADYHRSHADRITLAHPRGRVALEERGRGLPSSIYRYIYRAFFPPALWYYRWVDGRRR